MFSSSIFALVAGDTSIQAEILKRVDIEVKAWIANDPDTWVSVKDITTLYCQKYRELLREQAEAEILQPLGLDIPSFLAQQATMARDTVSNIAEQLTTYDFDTKPETIFMGLDKDGPVAVIGENRGKQLVYPQIYATYGDRYSCLSTVGFAAIGAGKSHAESQMMLTGHYPGKSFEDTTLVSYIAKKRSEVAPGVGKKTDMLIVGPRLGVNEKVTDELLSELDQIYERFNSAAGAALGAAAKENEALIKRIRKEGTEKESSNKTAETSEPQVKKKRLNTKPLVAQKLEPGP
jgi:hypothetical protein